MWAPEMRDTRPFNELKSTIEIRRSAVGKGEHGTLFAYVWNPEIVVCAAGCCLLPSFRRCANANACYLAAKSWSYHHHFVAGRSTWSVHRQGP